MTATPFAQLGPDGPGKTGPVLADPRTTRRPEPERQRSDPPPYSGPDLRLRQERPGRATVPAGAARGPGAFARIGKVRRGAGGGAGAGSAARRWRRCRSAPRAGCALPARSSRRACLAHITLPSNPLGPTVAGLGASRPAARHQEWPTAEKNGTVRCRKKRHSARAAGSRGARRPFGPASEAGRSGRRVRTGAGRTFARFCVIDVSDLKSASDKASFSERQWS